MKNIKFLMMLMLLGATFSAAISATEGALEEHAVAENTGALVEDDNKKDTIMAENISNVRQIVANTKGVFQRTRSVKQAAKKMAQKEGQNKRDVRKAGRKAVFNNLREEGKDFWNNKNAPAKQLMQNAMNDAAKVAVAAA